MSKKIITMMAILAMVFVCLNSTSCSSDDDDDNDSTSTSTTKDSVSAGKTDGEAFGAAYSTVKTDGYTSLSGITALAKMVTYYSKYKASTNTAYKAAFIAGATGVTGETEEVLSKYLSAESVSAFETLIKSLS